MYICIYYFGPIKCKHYPIVYVADELPGTLDGIIDLTGNFGVECMGMH